VSAALATRAGAAAWQLRSKHTPLSREPRDGGVQYLFRFENGYGASLIHNEWSYGIELAVIVWDSDAVDDFRITYKTPITHGVLGNLNFEGIEKTLDAILALPPLRNPLSAAAAYLKGGIHSVPLPDTFIEMKAVDA
jgi:hypothetical protein